MSCTLRVSIRVVQPMSKGDEGGTGLAQLKWILLCDGSFVDDPVNRRVPLCVDLDGTLLKTDLFFESLLTLIRRRPLALLQAPLWLLRGKAGLKAEIASRVDIGDVALPFNDDVVEFVSDERKVRKTVLVTGSHQSLADAVARRCELFDEVQGSDAELNLTGDNKRDWLVERFGRNGFDYVGNDRNDLKVWPAAREALAVSAPSGVGVDPSVRFTRLFSARNPGIGDYIGMMRIHQWLKNALLGVPYLLEHHFDDPFAFVAVLLGMLVMGLLASATYIINDLLDLPSDRRSPAKRGRALASGRVPITHGILAVPVLGLAAAVIASFLPPLFQLTMLGYLALTLCYSFVLKRVAIIDVIALSMLYTLRVVAGTLVIGAEWSFWLLAFAMFLFVSLALAKRVAELVNLERSGRHQVIGRDYSVADRGLLTMMGVVTGNLSVLIFVLYINSDKVVREYAAPQLLWLVCPVLMYWIGHIWLATHRGQMNEDPILFAFEDSASLITVGVLGVALALAMFL